MKLIEVRDYVLGISLGSFMHAGIHYIAQGYKHIQDSVDSDRTLEAVNVAPKKYPGLS